MRNYRIFKQPNGKYCSIGYNGTVFFDNYTEQDLINLYIEEARIDMKCAKRSLDIIETLVRSENETTRVGRNDYVKSLGFEQSYDEMKKHIPMEPLNQRYIACDFATHGKCPTCGSSVQDGIGLEHERCPECGQILKW